MLSAIESEAVAAGVVAEPGSLLLQVEERTEWAGGSIRKATEGKLEESASGYSGKSSGNVEIGIA